MATHALSSRRHIVTQLPRCQAVLQHGDRFCHPGQRAAAISAATSRDASRSKRAITDERIDHAARKFALTGNIAAVDHGVALSVGTAKDYLRKGAPSGACAM